MVTSIVPTEHEKTLLAFFTANECFLAGTQISQAAAVLTLVQGVSSIEENNHRMVRAVWPHPEDIRSGQKPAAFDIDVDICLKIADVAALDFLEFYGKRRRLVVCWADFIARQ